ncbi:glutamyl-tRNA reductase [Melioribacter sp. Ez-97]|uniref:glutamyl-tRNA reductase n=1 Tax=Melioribacter sp. Ez-97 TaxID=3423434 RepID=UPI003EDB2209
MNFVGITINHKTAPIEILESLHLNRDEIIEFISRLKENFKEGVIISTCNRTEIYSLLPNYNLDSNKIIASLLEFKKVENLKNEHFRRYFSCGAVKHLFSVAAGIDSMVIGDSQILGQVKEAYEISEDINFSGSVIKRVFEAALKVGKRAIKETAIGEGAVTVSYAAVQVVEKIYSNLDKKSALIIGAGETGELAAVHLRDKGVGKISISNRTLERAEKLAEKVNGGIIPFTSLKEHLHNYDIIISATSAENLIVHYEDLAAAVKKRKGQPIVIMDIAVPRDIDPKVKEIDSVFYHDMESLKVIVDQNIQKRKNEIPKIESIIMEEMQNFFAWYNTLEIVPVIKSLRNFFDSIREDELEKIKHKVTPEDFNKIEDMTRRLIGRLLHNPTIKLRQLAEQGVNPDDIANHSFLIKELFALENKTNGAEENNKEEN